MESAALRRSSTRLSTHTIDVCISTTMISIAETARIVIGSRIASITVSSLSGM